MNVKEPKNQQSYKYYTMKNKEPFVLNTRDKHSDIQILQEKKEENEKKLKNIEEK